MVNRYTINQLSLSYGKGRPQIVKNVSSAIPEGSFTAIIGANGCGKSTLLRGLSGLLDPAEGEILLHDSPLHRFSPKELAAQVGLLPQSATAPDSIEVRELVSRGRYPHQNFWHLNSEEDDAAIDAALEQTATTELATHRVSELSGGQRQRVWAAMLLAQQTEVLLLDEPTTFLDMAHQIDFLNLFTRLNTAGSTVVAVLHDLNQAARYADNLIAMREGKIYAEGTPKEVITPEILDEVFGLRCVVIDDPETGDPMIVPLNHRGAHL